MVVEKEFEELNNLQNLGERLTYIHESNILSDWSFKFADGREIKTHKLLLALHSPVYERRFYGSFACAQGELIETTSFEAMQWLVNHMYKNTIILKNVDLAAEIYIFCHEYQMLLVVSRCSQFLCSHVNTNNVLKLMDIAVLFDDPQLLSLCEMKIFEKSSMFSTYYIENVSKNAFLELIDKGVTRGKMSDLVTFQTVHQWAEAQVSKKNLNMNPDTIRKEMTVFLPLINFNCISTEQFLSEVVPTQIFTNSEALDILRLQFKEKSPILHMLSYTKLQNHNILMKKDCKVQLIDIVPKPNCNITFSYHNKVDVISQRIIVLESSEKIFLRSIRAQRKCYLGKWIIQVYDHLEKMVASTSSKGGPPWIFDKLVPIISGKSYTLKLYGKGTRVRHKLIEYNSTLDGVSFTGVCLSCSLRLEYWTSIDEFVP